MPEKTEFTLETWLKIITALIGIIGLFKAIYEYRKAQKWKQAEFLSKEMKEMLNDPGVKLVLLMLDWNEYKLSLSNNDKIHFKDDLLVSALCYHEDKPNGKYTEEEAQIRHLFDTFFEKLTTLQTYIDSGLFSHKDLEPYLIYYFRIIGDPKNGRKSASVRKSIWNFMDKYDYLQAKRLVSSYGFAIN